MISKELRNRIEPWIQCVTVRNRDTTLQERIRIDEIEKYETLKKQSFANNLASHTFKITDSDNILPELRDILNQYSHNRKPIVNPTSGFLI